MKRKELWRRSRSRTSEGGGRHLLWASVVAPALMEEQKVVRLTQALLAKVRSRASGTVLSTVFTAAAPN